MPYMHPPSTTVSTNQITTQLDNQLPFGPIPLTRAPSPNILGSNTQCGSALANEIDSYRRRIQTLVHFFDCIGQHWWDRLYPYKRDLIKRPSKSADEVRSYRSRLLVRLNKFTMRSVLPAAAAIAMMEAHATVKILPLNLLGPLSHDANVDNPVALDNSAVLLQKACSLARRLGDIEKLKQRLLLAALTWITSDGRNFNLRTQRIALLARHSEPCLIENFTGVRALLTHYYRPRILLNRVDENHDPSKAIIVAHAEPITAAKLTSTNEQIAEAIEKVCSKMRKFNVTSENNDTGNVEVDIRPVSNNATQQVAEILDNKPELIPNALSAGDLLNTNVLLDSQVPILPSIVLNPLSIDTSQLEWLSYEVNQKDFNLHVLNTEEPEDAEKPVYRPVNSPLADVSKQTMLPTMAIPKDKTFNSASKSVESVEFSKPSRLLSVWTSGTPITSRNSREIGWSPTSQVSQVSDEEYSYEDRPRFLSGRTKQDDAHRQFATDFEKILTDEPSESILTVNTLTARGEGGPQIDMNSPSWESSATDDSFPCIEPNSYMVVNHGGQGEEPVKKANNGSGKKISFTSTPKRSKTWSEARHLQNVTKRKKILRSKKSGLGSLKKSKTSTYMGTPIFGDDYAPNSFLKENNQLSNKRQFRTS